MEGGRGVRVGKWWEGKGKEGGGRREGGGGGRREREKDGYEEER